MKLLKIKIYLYGPLPFSLNLHKIKNWKSSIFQITDIQTINEKERIYTKTTDSIDNKPNMSLHTRDTIKNNFEFIKYDKLVDMNLIVTYVDLGEGWFLYSLKDSEVDNTFILSFMNIYEVLLTNHIPLENIIFSALYTYSIIFSKEGSLPTKIQEEEIMHLDTRGCLFDFDNNINDVKFFADCPVICLHCQESMIDSKLDIKKLQKELKRIKKSFFYRLYEDIKRNIIIYLILTSLCSVLLTKITSMSTYERFADAALTIAILGICLILIAYVFISSHIRKRKHYSQNINSQRTK